MSATRWTPQQQQAIEDRGGTLLLSAAAGSGKTAVLTQRAVEMIADEQAGIEADRLLIVTFTNAAAAELRQRMASALEKKLAANPASAYLKRQKLLLGRASICTVDSFCIDLLTRHFNETDLPGDFTLLKAAEETALRQEALEETLEEAYNDEDFCRFASLYGKARSDAAAADAVLRLYDITRSMADPEGWWAQLEEDYTVRTTPAHTRWGRLLLSQAQLQLHGIETRLLRALALLEECEELEKYRPALEDDLAQTRRLLEAANAADWAACCVRARSVSFLGLGRVSKNCPPALKGRVQALRNECKKKMQDLGKNCFPSDVEEFLAEQELSLPLVRALVKAVRRFAELLYQKKLEAKAFTFDDFEHAALKLLQASDGEKSPLARELSEQYALVMVDEYQDTNDLQNRLYQMLARQDQSNLFFVGDVKQSIYGFRQARPECFIEKRAAYAEYDGLHYPATILLSRNFRSTAGVIHAVNDVFRPVFCRSVGGVDYTRQEELIPGLEHYALDLPVEILLTDTAAQPEADTSEAETPAAAGKPDDSTAVTQCIAAMLRRGDPVREGEGTRPCRPGDFCILLRSPGSRGRRYTEKLEALGIGAFCQADDELLADPEVQLLLSFLRVLDNPGQDIHLAAVLLSPLFGFTPDDLTRIRLRTRKGTLYAALLREEDERIVAFLQQLRTLRRRALGMPVQEICAMLLDETGFYYLAGALPGGETCQQNLRAFQAVSAEYAGNGGLAGFLRLVDSALQNKRPLSGSKNAGAPADKVQLMSIHASKGLEFPIVILANAAQKFNEEDQKSSFLCHSELGVAFKLQAVGSRALVPTLAVRAEILRMKQEAAGEEMRLLYVALTRAKDRLILSWHDKTLDAALDKRALTLDACGGRPDALALQEAAQDGMSHWLQLALLNHPDAGVLRERCGWEDLPLRTDAQGHFTVSIVSAQPAEETVEEMPCLTAVPDEALLTALRQNFAVRPAVPLPLPVKVSVSALSHHEAAPVLDKPAFLYKEGMTAAQRGTALHSFLQLADLKAARDNAEGELARLVGQGYLEAEAAAHIERSVLQRFLQSDLLTRMLNAETLLREYEFISRIPASVLPEAQTLPAAGTGTVFLLGIADCILLNGSTAELVDYKTDRGKTEAEFLQAYSMQLALYRDAIEKRLGVQVRRSVLYSFSLGREIEVPLG